MRGKTGKHYHRLGQQALRTAHAARPLAEEYVALALAFDRLAVDRNYLERVLARACLAAGKPAEPTSLAPVGLQNKFG